MMRQAEQMVELLNLWAGADGMNRQRVRDSVFAKYGTTSSWDYSFGSVDENKLYRMRADLIAKLEKITGDINGDGVVDMADVLLLVQAFGTYSGDPLYSADCDLNIDGMVDVVDLLILVYNWPA